jgi:hypothetical protein
VGRTRGTRGTEEQHIKVLMGKHEGKGLPERPRKDRIKIYLK